MNIINNLDRSKFIPYLVTLNLEGNYEQELKSDVTFLKLDTKRLSRSVFKLAKIIKNENIDIVFSTIPRVNVISILATKLSFSKAKSVIREADNLGGSFLKNIQLLAFGLVYKLSDQIISLSEGVKENLVLRYKINPADIKVIYNPIDLKNIEEKVTFGQMEPHIKKLFNTEDKIIITAGRLVEQKDQKTLLAAFSRVNAEVNSRLIILGEGPLKNQLMELADKLDVRDRVHFIGFQQNPYIHFKQADLFVLSSKHEGFSHVIAEALATGVPVISTNCKSGPEEVLNKGEFGKLCEVGNVDDMAAKMLEVLNLERVQLDKMVNKGYERAMFFDAKKIVLTYQDVFKKVYK